MTEIPVTEIESIMVLILEGVGVACILVLFGIVVSLIFQPKKWGFK